ncbi:hypothetical protein SKAU_G00244530 [Synaphobranchus kaupii]|uniref:Uncharacterized protein n=1 Tax=Synaphobranchus kaupii TaxID=118154 RepID=A0A9Q1F1L7_SYNKA|nr:hypothetical protein SKAU_G00244530 [Synaphobranchus kaupii]
MGLDLDAGWGGKELWGCMLGVKPVLEERMSAAAGSEDEGLPSLSHRQGPMLDKKPRAVPDRWGSTSRQLCTCSHKGGEHMGQQ